MYLKQQYFFWWVVLCHLLLFSGFSWSWVAFQADPKPKELPSLDIPSYVYRQASSPVMEKQEVSPKAIKPAQAIKSMHFSQQMPAESSQNSDSREQPVHLIGDKKLDAPLFKMLGQALSAHLSYPKSAIDFNVKGVAMIGFTLYPDGHIADIQLVKSSSADVLDEAALAAARAMKPVGNVDKYLDNKPQFLVIGVIFG